MAAAADPVYGSVTEASMYATIATCMKIWMTESIIAASAYAVAFQEGELNMDAMSIGMRHALLLGSGVYLKDILDFQDRTDGRKYGMDIPIEFLESYAELHKQTLAEIQKLKTEMPLVPYKTIVGGILAKLFDEEEEEESDGTDNETDDLHIPLSKIEDLMMRIYKIDGIEHQIKEYGTNVDHWNKMMEEIDKKDDKDRTTFERVLIMMGDKQWNLFS